MVFDLLSLGSPLRVWSSASPFHPPVVLRFQRVPMAASGGDDESVPPELSAGVKQCVEKLREGFYNRHDGGTSKTNIEAPRLLNFSQETKAEMLRRQERKGQPVDLK